MDRIYFDHSATTPVDSKVLEAMLPYFSEKFGNAASLHSFGKEAREAIENARSVASQFFACQHEEIIFTSGATESNNLAIKGIIKNYYSSGKTEKPHIITTAFEHHCVMDACKSLEKEGLAEVTFLEVDKEGIVKLDTLAKAIKPNTILISIMYVNNEIGTVQPIKEIGEHIKKLKADRDQKIIFHTDATQAINYFDCHVDNLGVDMLSMSAHKIYGSKGIGLLYVRTGTPIVRIQDGGDQEGKKRAGTHNVTGIVGLGKAIEILAINKEADIKRLTDLRNRLMERVLNEIPDTLLNGHKTLRSPNNVNVSFKDVEGESLLLMLDMQGLACSTGSACTSNSLRPSHVLLAIGRKAEEAHGSIRMTLGKQTTEQEIDRAVEIIKETVSKLRKVSGQVLDEYYQDAQ